VYLPTVFPVPFLGPVHISVVSPTTDHTAFAAQRALEEVLRLLRQQYPMEMSLVEGVEVWSDTGKHFRAFVFSAFVLNTLTKALQVPCSLVFFVEHHGKSEVDAFIGYVRTLLNRLIHRVTANTAEELVAGLREVAGERAQEVEFADGTPARVHFVFADLSKQEPDYAFKQIDFGRVCLSRTYCLRAEVGHEGAVTITDHGFADVVDGTDVPYTVRPVARCAASARHKPQPKEARKRSDSAKLTAKYNVLLANAREAVLPRHADFATLHGRAYDLDIVPQGMRAGFARALVRVRGMRMLFLKAQELAVVGAVLTSAEADGDEPAVAVKVFGVYNDSYRRLAIAELAELAIAKQVLLLLPAVGDVGPIGAALEV